MDIEKILEIAPEIAIILAQIIFAMVLFKIQFKKSLEPVKEILEKEKNKYKMKKNIVEQKNIDTEIINRLEMLRETLFADRVSIHQFHNGSYLSSGREMLKATGTHQVVRAGIKPTLKQLANVPFSISAPLIEILLKNPLVDCFDFDEFQAFGVCRYYAPEEGYAPSLAPLFQIEVENEVEAATFILLKSCSNEPIGFLAINWVEKNHFTKNEPALYRTVAFLEASLDLEGGCENEKLNQKFLINPISVTHHKKKDKK